MRPRITFTFGLFLGLFSTTSLAQSWQVESSFGLLHSGVNQRIGLRVAAGRLTAKLGSTIHFNDQNTADSRNVVYYRTTHSYAWYNNIGAYSGVGYEVIKLHQDKIIISTEVDINAFNTGSLHSFQDWDGTLNDQGLPMSQSIILRHKTPFPQIQTSALIRSTFQVSEALFTFFEAGVGPYFIRQNQSFMLEARTGRPVYSSYRGWAGDPFAPFVRTGLGIALSRAGMEQRKTA